MKPASLNFCSFNIEIVKKRIKNIYFRIYPLKKTIVVSAPVYIDPETLNCAILSKKDWIIRQVNKIAKKPPSPLKTYTTGEEFLFKGKAYRLKVIEKDQGQGILISNDEHIHVIVNPGSRVFEREAILDGWCREEMKKSIIPILEKWQPLIGVKIRQFGVRKMKTRWGSCNINASRIWLNQALIHLPIEFLEYVTVHEMVHLLERGHNARFKGFMDRFIPDWRNLKNKLKTVQ
ncbi:MAG: hypothetical protein A2277_18270 [Desulfobacterales bacterium RIFOXYA12_FULL_46_15]|nr:MAG: hypothetical protein A2277_18270 [Desulfobacterales bacterium RIFOXYA12_FULL_46_15]